MQTGILWKSMRTVDVTLDYGDLTVTPRVLQGVKEMCVNQITANVRADQATMEISALNSARHRVPCVLTIKSARFVKRDTLALSATRHALVAVMVAVT